MDGYREHRLLTYAHAALPPLLTSPRWGEEPGSLPQQGRVGEGAGRDAPLLAAPRFRTLVARGARGCARLYATPLSILSLAKHAKSSYTSHEPEVGSFRALAGARSAWGSSRDNRGNVAADVVAASAFTQDLWKAVIKRIERARRSA